MAQKSLEIDEFTLQALAFTYRDVVTGKATSVQLDSASLAAGSAAGPICLDVRATFDGQRVEVDGTVSALTALIAKAYATKGCG